MHYCTCVEFELQFSQIPLPFIPTEIQTLCGMWPIEFNSAVLLFSMWHRAVQNGNVLLLSEICCSSLNPSEYEDKIVYTIVSIA